MKLKGCSWQLLAGIVLKTAGGVLEFDTVQRKFKLSVMQVCVRNHIHNGHVAPFWMPEPQLLHFDF